MVKKTAKNQLNRGLLRRIILRTNRPVSRQELIQATGLNPRTVDSYTKELENKGLIVRCSPPEDMRPHGIIFRANSQAVVFLGIYMSHTIFSYVITDIDYTPLKMESIPVSKSKNTIPVFFDKLINAVESFSTKKLLGIGMVFHPYLQSQQNRIFFHDLSVRLRERYSVPLIVLDSPNSWLYELYHTSNLLHAAFNKNKDFNIGLLHLSDRVYPALIIGGEPMRFSLRSNSKIKKLLDGVFCHSMIVEKLNLPILPTNNPIHAYRESVYLADPAACKVSLEEAERLALVIRRLKSEFNLDHFFLTNIIPHTFEALRKSLAKETDTSGFVVEPLLEPKCLKNLSISSMLAINNSIAPPTFEFLTL